MEEEIGTIASDTRADEATGKQDHYMAQQVQQGELNEEREEDLRKEEIAEPNEDMNDGIVVNVVQYWASHLGGNPASSRRSSAARVAATVSQGSLLSISAALALYWAAVLRPSAFQRRQVVAIATVRKGGRCNVVEIGYTWSATLRPLGAPAPRGLPPPLQL